MTRTADNRRYAQGAVYGSLAYDLSNPELYPEMEYERSFNIPAPPKIEEEVVTQAVARTRQSIAPMSIIGFACAAVLLVFSLMAQIQLTAVSDETAQLESQLNELGVENARLLIDYESAFNLAEIEEYATMQLGMQKTHQRSGILHRRRGS